VTTTSTGSTGTAEYQEPTYGNWQKPRSPGVYGQGMLGTGVLLGGIVVSVLTGLLAGFAWAAVVMAFVVLGLVPFTVRIGGRSAAQYVLARSAWWWGTRSRRHVYRSGALSAIPAGRHQLPGLLAQSVAHEFVDGHDRRFALVEHPGSGLWTILIHCQPEGVDLVDPEVLDHRLAGWAGFLSAVGRLDSIAAAQQVVEIVPDPGSRLHAEVQRLTADDAPEMAADDLAERAALLPRGQAMLSSRTSLSWSTPRSAARRAKRDRPQAMAEFVAGLLPGILSSLSGSGAGVVTPMAVAEVAEELAMAYDPACASDIEQARVAGVPTGIDWADAGPVGMVEQWDQLQHDSATSVTWSMMRPPLGAVWRSSMAPLFAPDAEITRKRIALTYRPFSPDRARTRVRRDMRSALFKMGQAGVADVSDKLDVDAQRRTEEALAKGASLASFSLHVTATVQHSASNGHGGGDLEQAVANIESVAKGIDVRLRRCYGHQSAAFSAALGVGVVLPRIVRVPQGIRDNL
jgi:hypothetical protein